MELTFGIGRKEKFVAQLAEHPSVKRFYEGRTNRVEVPTDQVLDAAWLT